MRTCFACTIGDANPAHHGPACVRFMAKPQINPVEPYAEPQVVTLLELFGLGTEIHERAYTSPLRAVDPEEARALKHLRAEWLEGRS